MISIFKVIILCHFLIALVVPSIANQNQKSSKPVATPVKKPITSPVKSSNKPITVPIKVLTPSSKPVAKPVSKPIKSTSQPITQQSKSTNQKIANPTCEPAIEPKALTDFGERCNSNDQCQSGVCGYSCSANDYNPFSTTSCVCACNSVDNDGPCCCGCVNKISPHHAISCAAISPPVFAYNSTSPNKLVYPYGDFSYLYPRLTEANILNDDEVIVLSAKQAVIKLNYTGEVYPGAASFGTMCQKNSDCEFGICGTGCDCDSTIEKTCSCNAQSHFPVMTCAGCNRGKGAKGVNITACPTGVGIEQVDLTTSTSPYIWLPQANADVSVYFCTEVQLMMNDPVYGKYVPYYPDACQQSGIYKEVNKAFDKTNKNDPEQVEKLYSTLVKLLTPKKPCTNHTRS